MEWLNVTHSDIIIAGGIVAIAVFLSATFIIRAIDELRQAMIEQVEVIRLDIRDLDR